MTQAKGQGKTKTETEPGADRFWGEFSKAKAGRSHGNGQTENQPADDRSAEGSDRPDAGHHSGECLEWCPICRSAELIRTAVPPELRDQAEALQREAVSVLRAFLTAYSERTSGAAPAGEANESPPEKTPPEPSTEPTDIPLD